MTKIDIISGFLGAGKTTLIRKLLEEAYNEEKIVLVENEFGEIGIDSGFLKDSGIKIEELNSGCICCTLIGDFKKSLTEVIETFNPDRILIEPSGVGKLSDVMLSVKSVEKDYPDAKLNGLVTVVNASKAHKQMKAFGEFFSDQLENAATIILSRTQTTDEEKLEACVLEIKEVAPNAAIITTPWDEIEGRQILNVIEGQNSFMDEMMKKCEHEHHHGEGCCHEHKHSHEHHHEEEHLHEHHHADEIFESWGKETPHKFSKDKLESFLKIFTGTEDYGTILRAKGIVPSENDTWIYFDMVPGEYDIREGQPDYTGRICVIGTDLKEDKLDELFS